MPEQHIMKGDDPIHAEHRISNAMVFGVPCPRPGVVELNGQKKYVCALDPCDAYATLVRFLIGIDGGTLCMFPPICWS